MDLIFEKKKKGDIDILKVIGEIDLYNAKQLREKSIEIISNRENIKLIIDLRKVDYIDSAGLGILIGVRKRVMENNGKLVIIYNSPKIDNLFSITGLKKVLNLANELDKGINLMECDSNG